MIRINNKIGSLAPDILLVEGVAESENLKTEFNNGAVQFTFISTIYGHKNVKDRLIELQYGKCCFCESKIRHISYGDVEHYRPKGGWVQNEEAINQPGYYWLAYDWDNLLLSCELCNQRYKRNYFPIINEAQRAINHTFNIENETPIFIHPVFDDPEEYIEFNDNEPYAVDGNARGNITINKLALDREELNEHRKRTLNLVIDIYELAKGYPDTNPIVKNKAKNKITKYHEAAQQDSTEYASMLRCFFRKNPIDF